jgi:hypothetical protein
MRVLGGSRGGVSILQERKESDIEVVPAAGEENAMLLGEGRARRTGKAKKPSVLECNGPVGFAVQSKVRFTQVALNSQKYDN